MDPAQPPPKKKMATKRPTSSAKAERQAAAFAGLPALSYSHPPGMAANQGAAAAPAAAAAAKTTQAKAVAAPAPVGLTSKTAAASKPATTPTATTASKPPALLPSPGKTSDGVSLVRRVSLSSIARGSLLLDVFITSNRYAGFAQLMSLLPAQVECCFTPNEICFRSLCTKRGTRTLFFNASYFEGYIAALFGAPRPAIKFPMAIVQVPDHGQSSEESAALPVETRAMERTSEGYMIRVVTDEKGTWESRLRGVVYAGPCEWLRKIPVQDLFATNLDGPLFRAYVPFAQAEPCTVSLHRLNSIIEQLSQLGTSLHVSVEEKAPRIKDKQEYQKRMLCLRAGGLTFKLPAAVSVLLPFPLEVSFPFTDFGFLLSMDRHFTRCMLCLDSARGLSADLSTDGDYSPTLRLAIHDPRYINTSL